MSECLVISCDKCGSGAKYKLKCKNGHDICEFCFVKMRKINYCPLCLEDAELSIADARVGVWNSDEYVDMLSKKKGKK